MSITELMLHEELLLLSLNERGAGRSDLAVAGGLLAELAFRGLVEIDKEGKKAFVRSTGSSSTGSDELLDECLADVAASSKRRQAAHWVSKFSTKKHLKSRVAGPLVARGVLDEHQRTFLFIEFTQYPELDPVPEARMTERLRSAIEYDHITPDPRTAALAAIANAAGLLGNNLDKKMLRARKGRLKDLGEGEHIAEAVKAAVDAVNAALIVAVAAGAATSS